MLFEHWQQQHGALSPEVIMVTHRSVMPEGFTEFNTQGVQHADTISDAMQQAAALIPNNASGEVTLISDGMATDQHWQTTVAHLAARGIPLSVLALPAQQTHAVIADVAVQPWYHGQQFQAEVNILGADNAKSGNELRLVLRQQGRELARVEGINNQQALVSIKAALPDNEINTLELALMDGATIVSQKTLTLGRQAPLSLLYVSTHPEQLNALATLLGSGFTITSVTPTALHDVADLAQFTAVIMDDVASEQLPLPQQQRLLTAVNEQGVGLLYAGARMLLLKKI
ncbi:hypothetical protein KHX94_10850 [Shewanella dokdonensis]|uniref:Uncharacterized protein n=1 Tax=Shewanella dokdonensis TaxID=712036 RepID=A0ABX8DBM4_9GAMM|nr:hypothetical protein [Shewanella dokdonensis]QVK21988.1 hypothetical protein KHX94_10850 [Shewanella dokdonensis]